MIKFQRPALCVAVLVLCALSACSPAPRPSPSPANLERLAQVDGTSVARVAADASPSVVGIATVSLSKEGAVSGIGTGVIVSEDGYILTNHHVAGGVSRLEVIFSDGSSAPGETLWSDAALDLAVVKIDGRHPAVTLASSADVLVGETIVAIGTPITLQFQHTVTSGIVSAVNRTLQLPADGGESFLEDLIQHDASINPGNSGGPLLNLRGEVIGINTVKVTQAEGIGFAIPVDVALPILEHFYRDGRFEMPYAGIFAMDANMARYYDESIEVSGLVVIGVDPYGPAAGAGIRQGDVLTEADGGELFSLLDLRCALVKHLPGEQMQLAIERGGTRYLAAIELSRQP